MYIFGLRSDFGGGHQPNYSLSHKIHNTEISPTSKSFVIRIEWRAHFQMQSEQLQHDEFFCFVSRCIFVYIQVF